MMFKLQRPKGALGRLAILSGVLALASSQSADAALVAPSVSQGLSYAVVDSGAAAPTLADTFIDTTAGTSVAFNSDDSFVSITAPFAVSIDGDTGATGLRVHDNGYLTIGNAAISQPSNGGFPNDAFSGNGVIAPFWDDLLPKGTSAIRTFAPDANTFVVEWVDMAHFDDPTASYNFQVVFFANKQSEILIQYGSMTNGTGTFADGSSASSGIQNAARDGFVVLTDRTADIAANFSVDFDFDTDRDGLPASVEDFNRDGALDAGESDPALFDTDSGGTGDGGEVVSLATDPQAAGDDDTTDGDSDNISDADEPVIGTNPALADSDGDGLNDDVEYFDNGTNFISNPNSRDTDGDLLSDFEEVNLDGDATSFAAGTDADPALADTDGGGESDGSEVIAGRDPNDGGDDSALLGATQTAMSVSADDRRTMHAAVDNVGNVHVVSTRRQSNVQYGMAAPDGTTLIGSTLFTDQGKGTFAHVFTLPSGRVAIVSAQGRNSGVGGIFYRLIDPALDDQNGNAANVAVNPNTPATIGDGVTLIERVAVTNPGGAAQGYRHLNASFDGANIHLVFQAGQPSNGNVTAFYAKIKAESGALLTAPIQLTSFTGPNDNTNAQRLPTHRRRQDRVFGDSQGRAHIIFQGLSRRPSNGAFKSDVLYARIGADGSIERPLSVVVSNVNNHNTFNGVAVSGNTIFLTHSNNPGGSNRVQAGGRADVVLQRLDAAGLFPIESRVLDGPSLDSIPRSYQDISSAVTSNGSVVSMYMDARNGNALRFTAVGPDGRTVVPPTQIDQAMGNDQQRKRHQSSVVVSPDGTHVALAWYRDNSARIDYRSLDLTNPVIGAISLVNITVAAGGQLAGEAGSAFADVDFVFDANDVTADTFGILRTGTIAATLSGNPLGAPIQVELATGGATLQNAATFDVTLPIDPSFTGNPAELQLVQVVGNTVTTLASTFNAAANTMSATGTALGVFAIVHNPTVNFAFVSTPVTSAAINFPYSYTAQVASATPVNYSLLSSPSGMTIGASSGLISWTPSVSQVGQFPVSVLATNGFESLTQSYVISVSSVANSTPVFVSAPLFRAQVGEEYTYTPEIVDPDASQTHVYSLFTSPSGMSIDAVTGTITWTPTEAQTGSNAVSIVVSDGFGTSSQIFAIDVLGATGDNTAPQFTSSPALQVYAGDDFNYTAQALDADGDSLTYTLLTAPDGMTIDAASGVVSWSTNFDHVGSNPVSIEVSDGTVSAAQIFAVEVLRVAGDDNGGCGCHTTSGGTGATSIAMMLLALVFAFRRKRSRD